MLLVGQDYLESDNTELLFFLFFLITLLFNLVPKNLTNSQTEASVN